MFLTLTFTLKSTTVVDLIQTFTFTFPIVNFPFSSSNSDFLNKSQLLKKDIQHNGQMKKDKGENNGLQNTTQKTKDQTTRTPIKTGG